MRSLGLHLHTNLGFGPSGVTLGLWNPCPVSLHDVWKITSSTKLCKVLSNWWATARWERLSKRHHSCTINSDPVALVRSSKNTGNVPAPSPCRVCAGPCPFWYLCFESEGQKCSSHTLCRSHLPLYKLTWACVHSLLLTNWNYHGYEENLISLYKFCPLLMVPVICRF